ncbi:uncharacterized protein LOC115316868 [Ixodes scapularis]|uniref:uncharacterized protein LOC115316868 n=1 Tax=Ixodes scapularis TaxID=6945 RepID=UPI001A9CC193|nr:uncharacterized protein LOC115316868 [Ixodes scapularis]
MAALNAEHGDAERAERPFDAEALLELVREHRFLFDHSQPDFKDTQMKENRWKIIEEQLGMKEGTAATKFANLKDRWRRLKNKLDAAKKSGAGASDVPKISWRYFAIIHSMMATERLGTTASNLILEPASPADTIACTEEVETEEPAVELESRPAEPPAPTKQAGGRPSGGPPKPKRKKTATPPSDDLGEVKEAYIEAMRTVARPNPPHRCNLFFDFVAETAKSLSAKEQDELMHKCHIALLEVRYEENN